MSIPGDILAAEMLFEDNAIIGVSRIVITQTRKIKGVSRIMFGGVVLSDQMKGVKTWQCMDGMVCLVPSKIVKVMKDREGCRIDQLMTNLSCLTEEDKARCEAEDEFFCDLPPEC